MAGESCEKYDGLSQKLDRVLKDIEDLKQTISQDMEDLKQGISLDMEDLKQMISQVITAQGLRPKVLPTLMVDNKAAESISEQSGYGAPNASSSYSYSMSPPQSIRKPYYPDPALLNPEPSPELRPPVAPPSNCLSHLEPGSITNPRNFFPTNCDSTKQVLPTLMVDNKAAESISEEHSGYGGSDASSSYSYSMSPSQSVRKLYYPDPALLKPEPSPELRPRVAPPSNCLSHLEPGSIPTIPNARRFFSDRRESELFDARFVQSLDSKNFEHVDTSGNKNDLRGVYSKFAPSVVSVSSFLGAAKIIDCSGLIIDWNASENEATILTSAKLLWSPDNSGCEIQLIVRLGDGTSFLATEDYVDFYHNFITLKVKSVVELEVVDLRSRQEDIVEGMNVSALGRSFYTCSLFDFSGKLHLEDPLFGCDELLRSTLNVCVICEGGPLITDVGYVVGINLFGNCVCAHILPTPIILTCLEMWRSFSNVVRPFLGMSVVDVDCVPYEIWKRFNISPEESYVAVKEVYKGSLADINGVRSGDLVVTCNGIPIKSAKQYYKLVSETSRAVTACGDSGQQSFIVVIDPFDGRTDSISIEADNVSVNDTRFYDCWPRIEDDGLSWLKLKLFKWRLMSDRKLKQSKRQVKTHVKATC